MENVGFKKWTLAAGMATAVLTTLFVSLKPPSSSGFENGSFVNDCCGSLRLHDGEMMLNDKVAARYTVGRDARGAYVLPRTYVGSLEGIGFEIDGARRATKMRLDRIPDPTNILVQGGTKKYVFKRQPAISPAGTPSPGAVSRL